MRPLLFVSLIQICAAAPQSCCASLTSVIPSLDNCGGSRPVGAPFATRSPTLSFRGQVASAHPLASQAGLDILKAGGSAVDAAIATNLVLAVVEPMMNGPGGDLMAIVFVNETLYGYNGAGRAPMNFSLADLRSRLAEINALEIPTSGPLAITVPGAPRGWCDLHARFGKLSWQSLFASAIDVATNGYPVPQIIAYEWNDIPDSSAITSGGRFPHAHDGWAATFGIPQHSEGSRFSNPALARTLSLLRDGGCDAFYVSGAVPDALAALAETAGTTFSAADLAAHVGEWVTPISTTYRGVYNLHQLPPNPQGAAALEMLNILEAYNFSAVDFNSADYLHAHVEAKKLAFADASFYFADPLFVSVPVDALVSKPYATTRRALINMTSAAKTDAPGAPQRLEDVYGGDTTYLTAADSDGNMVSLIQSLYTGFGSGVVAPSLGFALQSRGALFSVQDGAANVYAPGKRPFHTIMPGFVTGPDSFALSYGVMGGFMQPQGHAQILSNILDHRMNVQEAGDAARYYHSGSSTPMGDRMTDGGVLQLEAGVCDAVVANLTARGHTVVRGSNTGGYQAILRARSPTGDLVFSGATEMRKDGLVAAW
jgi:gamma-glutamyltranspeptidase/glutathione hydrolase